MATHSRLTDPAQPGSLPRLVAPTPFALLDQPLEYVFREHLRHRTVCALLRSFAGAGSIPRHEADSLAAFLQDDLALHHADEDEDLFPALRRRALPQDNLGPVFARLAEDHLRSEGMADAIVAVLTGRPAANPVRLDAASRDLLEAYAATEHRHLAIENGVVLAIARVRLTRSDLTAMSRNMKARRGVNR